jgi:hypothetical protein
MRFKTVLLIGVMFLIIATACSDRNTDPVSSLTITGSGVMASEGRTVPSFHSVSLTTVGNVLIGHSAQQSVNVTVDDNIMPFITTTVSGGVLVIGSNQSVSLSDFDLTVNIAMPELRAITLNGVGNLTGLSQFAGDTLNLTINGVGNIVCDADMYLLNSTIGGVGNLIVSGQATRHVASLASVGNLESFGLMSDTALVTVSGQGNAEVNVADYLNVSISGAGSVLYRGQPNIDVFITGSGSVIDAN